MINMDLNYKKDLFRYYGKNKPSFLQIIFSPYELRYIKWYRYCQRHSKLVFGKYILRNIFKKTYTNTPNGSY